MRLRKVTWMRGSCTAQRYSSWRSGERREAMGADHATRPTAGAWSHFNTDSPVMRPFVGEPAGADIRQVTDAATLSGAQDGGTPVALHRRGARHGRRRGGWMKKKATKKATSRGKSKLKD